ncbi:Catechol 2,3-dioxygenase [Alteromonadaceae bacterium Bs31]|nr:Catechol 2,3-dioxygenase [Alteromonadaceae bacterium Bs31]
MKLGAFSISLNVNDIKASKEFYQKLGFKVFGGDISQNWLMLKNESGQIVGLFEGMLEKNTLTFNPGWDQNAENLPAFDDIRELQKSLLDKGLDFVSLVEADSDGPASFVIEDPDGNPILVDQHR